MKKEISTTKPKRKLNLRANTLGILQLFVVVSVAYMAYVVILGTSGITPKAMCAPAILWIAFVAVQKFTKN